MNTQNTGPRPAQRPIDAAQAEREILEAITKPRAMRALRTTPAERTERRRNAAYTEDDVLCPFFKRFRPLKICCEGITEDCTLQLSFKSRAGMDRQAIIFCSDKWRNCEVARAVMEQYE